MSKLILKSLLIAALVAPAAPAAFADTNDEPLGPFNRQGDDLKYPKPESEEKFFATRASMPSVTRTYLGLSIGANSSSLKPTALVAKRQLTSSGNSVYSGIANIYGGIATNIRYFYIGAELSGGYNTLNKTINLTSSQSSPQTTTVKQSITAGIDIMPGFYFNYQKNFLLYGRIGFGGSSFSTSTNINTTSSKTNNIVTGLRTGFGGEYFMSDTFSVRLEYLYSSYRNISYTYSNTYSNSTGANYSYQILKPKTQQVNLGLTLNF